MTDGPRLRNISADTNPVHGRVVWAPVKSIWYTLMVLVTMTYAIATFSWSAAVVAASLTVVTICMGHSIGFHRLLIHRSFTCPLWLERTFVSLGVLVGMGGPRKMLYMHDIRDWSQRHEECHAFYIHTSSIWKDWFWNLHCELRLHSPPKFRPEKRVTTSTLYRFYDQFWMLVQLPLALILYLSGGLPFVVWGVCVRITLSLTGHWLVGFLAHNTGLRRWHVEGAAVQGFNVPGFGLLSMGEAWHNNHHAFPESARMGLEAWQPDAGWWVLKLLSRCSLVQDLKEPRDLPHRQELKDIRSTGRREDALAQNARNAVVTGFSEPAS